MTSPDPATWATLLAGWIEFAQSAVALPDDASGQRWKDSVAPAIGLHAIAMALGELHTLEHDERALAMDKAELAIKGHARELGEVWGAEPMPGSLIELVEDAKVSWECSLHEGVVWCAAGERFVSDHPGPIGMALREAGFAGEVFVSTPGIPLFRGAPVAWCRERSGGMPDERVVGLIDGFLRSCEGAVGDPQLMRPIHQVYRQFDFARGGASKDLVAPVIGDLPSGQPLLVSVICGGEVGAVPLPPKGAGAIGPVEVEWTSEEEREDGAGARASG